MQKFRLELLDFSADLVQMADRLCEKRTFPPSVAEEMSELSQGLHAQIAATMAFVDLLMAVLGRKDHG